MRLWKEGPAPEAAGTRMGPFKASLWLIMWQRERITFPRLQERGAYVENAGLRVCASEMKEAEFSGPWEEREKAFSLSSFALRWGFFLRWLGNWWGQGAPSRGTLLSTLRDLKESIPHSQACFKPSSFHAPGPELPRLQHWRHLRGGPIATTTKVTPLPPAYDHGPPQGSVPSSVKERLLIPLPLRLLWGQWDLAGHRGPTPEDGRLLTQMRTRGAKSPSLSFFKDKLEIWMLYLESLNYLKIMKIAVV